MATYTVNYSPTGRISTVNSPTPGDDLLIVDWGAATEQQHFRSALPVTVLNEYRGFFSIGDIENPDTFYNKVTFTGIMRFDIRSGAASDEIVTGNNDDIVSTGAGNDQIKTQGGAAIVDGGAGIDRWSAWHQRLTGDIFVDLSTSTVTGLGNTSIKGIEALGTIIRPHGNAGIASRFVTGKGNDTITTLLGPDNAIGDRISTSEGSDTVTVGGGSDEVFMNLGLNDLLDDDLLIVDYSGFSTRIITPKMQLYVIGYDDWAGTFAAQYLRTTFVNFKGVERFDVRTGSGSDEIITGGGADLISLGKGNDVAKGGAGDDRIDGGDGNDTLDGEAGNDALRGGRGSDIMRGGGGDDTYFVDHLNDVVDESTIDADGIDKVYTSVSINLSDVTRYIGQIEQVQLIQGFSGLSVTGDSHSNTLIGNEYGNVLNGAGGADVMRGMFGYDTYVVDNLGDIVDESLPGSGGNDTVQASISVDLGDGDRFKGDIERIVLLPGIAGLSASGNSLANVIIGNTFGNVINGKGGNDVLTGGYGVDRFVFDTALSGAANVDTITDFNVLDDKIHLDDAIFKLLGGPGSLSADRFKNKADGPIDADDRIIYNHLSGALTYDTNGSAAGGSTLFAWLPKGLAINNTDFVVI